MNIHIKKALVSLGLAIAIFAVIQVIGTVQTAGILPVEYVPVAVFILHMFQEYLVSIQKQNDATPEDVTPPAPTPVATVATVPAVKTDLAPTTPTAPTPPPTA